MRGKDTDQTWIFSYVPMEDRIPVAHPIRRVREIADEILMKMSRDFATLYSALGRPSIPPEKLMRALLLQVLYSVRSERLLMERLNYDLLFRWFVGLSADEPVWDPTVFSKNRDRLLNGAIAEKFFDRVSAYAHKNKLMSDEHFSVDSTLMQAWASQKSFQPKENPPEQGSGRRGELQLNDTHESKTDPDARLYRTSKTKQIVPSYLGHVVMENRNGLIAAVRATIASKKQEWECALELIKKVVKRKRATVGADKAYDERTFVADLRKLGITPHVAQYDGKHRRSYVDGRTTRQPGYRISLEKRKRIEQIFGWLKSIGLLRQVKLRGLKYVRWLVDLNSAAYNLVRITRLLPSRT